MIKLTKKILMILIVTVFMISMVTATAYAVNTPTEKKVVEFKEKKVSSYKIKWDANGGNIGNKKTLLTNVKKGAKIKIPKTPKKTGYTFEGWYSKKSSGTKITKNTKVSKSAIFYAHWKKKKILTSEEKKLIGSWYLGAGIYGGAYDSYTGAYLHATGSGAIHTFNTDGTYTRVSITNTEYSKYVSFVKAYWRMSGGTVYITNQQYQSSNNGGTTWTSWKPVSTPNISMKIAFGSDQTGSYFENLEYGTKWRKN